MTPQVDPKTGTHWLADRATEKALEEYRQKNHPDLPSRLKCVYGSYTPHSRFVRKGHLYVVEPQGTTLTTSSQFIDELRDRYRPRDYSDDGRERGVYISPFDNLIEWYWKGVEPSRANLADVEVLMESAVVVSRENEQHRLRYGDVIQFGPGVSIDVTSNVYKDGVYLGDGFSQVSFEQTVDLLKLNPGITVNSAEKPDDTDESISCGEIKMTLHSPGVFMLRRVMGPEPGQKQSYNGFNMTIVTSPNEKKGISAQLYGAASRYIVNMFKKGKITLVNE